MVLTLLSPAVGAEGLRTAAVAAGGVTVPPLPSSPAPGTGWGRHRGCTVRVAGTLRALGRCPGRGGTAGVAGRAVGGTVHLIAREVYRGPYGGPALNGSWAVVVSFGVIAAVGIGLGFRRPLLLGIGSAAIGFAAAVAPVIAGSTVIVTLAVTTAAVVLTELVAAWLDRTQPEYGWALLTARPSSLCRRPAGRRCLRLRR